MGKKNKKAGGNTKKVKETTAVSVEVCPMYDPKLMPRAQSLLPRNYTPTLYLIRQ
jgi:hypothetical protein